MADIISLEEFYRSTTGVLPEDINRQIGHFNVFKIDEWTSTLQKPKPMPYNRRAYYKISAVSGRNKAEYADKEFNIEQHGLLFATPKIPYNFVPQDDTQAGYFCIFTADFLLPSKSGVVLDDLPIFRPGGYPVFQLTEDEVLEIHQIFKKMYVELASDYAFKYDLLRNYVLELIHYGQKLQPAPLHPPTHGAANRVHSLFVELLERQFPIDTPHQKLQLRTAKDYADRLAVHVNHLNKVLKESTGKTTTDLISGRILQEAKIMLKQTDWNISEISNCLGFEEVAHFSNFFKKQTDFSPVSYRA